MGNDEEMIKYQIWLQLALGAGSVKSKAAVEFFGNAELVYRADENSRKSSGIFNSAELKKMSLTPLTDSLRVLGDCNKEGIKTVALGDKNYPYCLSVIDNPPLVLYYKGESPDFDNNPSICIVGPRNVSEFGKKAAYSLGYRLARSGMTVISGGAVGADAYAHAGALKAEGKTVVVMGSGIAIDYPIENKSLRENVIRRGCVISEYPPYVNATKYTFPIRNRILSALSLGTVIIEAGQRSGALITARHALEQGRDVFVIPGSPDKPEYSGSNQLLRDGAKPLLDASDIFNEYIVRFPDKINIERAYSSRIITDKKAHTSKKIEKNQKNLNQTLSKEAKIVYNQLDKQKFFPEEIRNTGLSSGELLSALTELEMEFLIRACPGGMFEKL